MQQIMEQEILDTAQEVFDNVSKELYRQYGKWGRQFHDVNVWNTIVLEEYGELAKAVNDAIFYDVKEKERDSINGGDEDVHNALWYDAQKELCETIACLVQMYVEIGYCLDYKPSKKEHYGNG